MGDTGRNIGDRIYWKYFGDKTMGSATIKRIEDETYVDYDKCGNPVETKYKMYYTSDNICIEDYSCLAKSDPKRKEYEKLVSRYIKSRTASVYRAVLGADRKPTKSEKDLIDKTVKYMAAFNLSKELAEKFDYEE